MKKIMVVVGTRPEAIKLAPVYKALKSNPNFHTLLLTTGQHGENMLNPLLDFFEIQPDIALALKNKSLSHFASLLMHEFELLFTDHRPDLVIVQGDTTSCMVGSLSAFYHSISVAHVEAGLRTYNRQSPFPEEINRRITSLVTSFHFAPTEVAMRNLVNENVQGNIEIVGNTVIDSLLSGNRKVQTNAPFYEKKYAHLFREFEKLVLITGHRRENIGNNFREIYDAIYKLAEQYKNISFIYPLHTNPLVRSLAIEMLSNLSNVFLVEPLPYDDLIFLMSKCYLVMTDSGGIQEECPSLNKPVIVLRDTTERPEGIEAGCSVLAGVKSAQIIEIFTKLMTDMERHSAMAKVPNPYGQGDSSARIVRYLESFFYDGEK